MTKTLRTFVVLAAFGMVACSEVTFTESESCGTFGQQECIVDPASGVQHFDNTINVGPGFADILFINDNSGSMSTEQEKMGKKFPTFIQSLGNIDYRIAIATTDISSNSNPPDSVNQNGALQNGHFIRFSNGSDVLTPNMSSVAELFNETIQRPETVSCEQHDFDENFCPSPDERGIFAANLAVERNHPEFFRPEAHLAIVILSDEDERSRGGDIPGFGFEYYDHPEVLIHNIKTRLGATKSFAVHAIIIKPGDSSCLSKQNRQTGVSGFEGETYESLAEMTDGHVGSVCARNYGVEMGQIGAAVAEEVNSVQLACVPINDEFTATVSPSVSGLTTTLDKEAQKIRFNKNLPAGATVRLIYDCAN